MPWRHLILLQWTVFHEHERAWHSCIYVIGECFSSDKWWVKKSEQNQTCWGTTFPLLPFPPSWSSHCQSTPRTTRPPANMPRAVIFFDLRRDSKRTLCKHKSNFRWYALEYKSISFSKRKSCIKKLLLNIRGGEVTSWNAVANKQEPTVGLSSFILLSSIFFETQRLRKTCKIKRIILDHFFLIAYCLFLEEKLVSHLEAAPCWTTAVSFWSSSFADMCSFFFSVLP